MPGRRHVSATAVGAGLGLDAEVGNTAALSANPIVVASTDRAILVEVVGIVVADLGSLVGQGVKLGKARVGVLDIFFQPQPHQPCQVAIALGPVKGVTRGFRPQQLPPRHLQGLAEGFPVGTVHWRAPSRIRPVASAVPSRIKPQPIIISSVTTSSRNAAPITMAARGTRKVTVIARDGPSRAMRRK